MKGESKCQSKERALLTKKAWFEKKSGNHNCELGVYKLQVSWVGNLIRENVMTSWDLHENRHHIVQTWLPTSFSLVSMEKVVRSMKCVMKNSMMPAVLPCWNYNVQKAVCKISPLLQPNLLARWSHRKKILGLNPPTSWGPSVWSVYVGPLWVLRRPPTHQRHACWLTQWSETRHRWEWLSVSICLFQRQRLGAQAYTS